ncbi:MAG: flagellar basal body-associated FliL family protein, partial [Fimbriimonadales bacterium]|nr:flagellar basal body-associated FliL family protein [Fimbriimonadales bacterium]
FLVNLEDEKTFLKTHIALGIMKGYKEEEIKEQLPRIRDAIVMVLTSKQPKQVVSNAGKARLKKEILFAVNKLFQGGEEETSSEENGDSANKKTGSTEKAKEKEASSKSEPPKGPVLEVYFTSFATQRY